MRNGMSTNVETNNTRITAVSAIPRRRERNSLSGLCATEFLSRESQKYRANKQPIKGSATIYSSRYLVRKMAIDRKSGVEGKGVSVRVDLGGRRISKKKKKKR